MDFYKDLIAMDKRFIKGRKELIMMSQNNLKSIKSKKGENGHANLNWFVEYYRERIIKDSDSIKEARERIKENKQSIADLKARQEDKTTNVCLDLHKDIQEIKVNCIEINRLLDELGFPESKPMRKPQLTFKVIKGGLS